MKELRKASGLDYVLFVAISLIKTLALHSVFLRVFLSYLANAEPKAREDEK